MITGMIAMLSAANSAGQSASAPALTEMLATPWVIIHLSGLPASSTRGSRYWFHWAITLKIAIEIRPGLAIGSMIRKNVLVCPQPSIIAASATVVGSVLKNAAMKKTVNGSEEG